MRVLVVLIAALACVVAKPAAVSYAYSAIAPWSGYPYASAYSPLATAYSPLATAYSPLATAYSPLAYSSVLPAVASPLAYTAPVSPVLAAAGVKSQYHAQDELGQASYGHAEPGQTHNAVQDAAGNKVGSFSFINPEGKLVQTSYVADAAGYRVASNDLPVAPVHAAIGPAPIADTPEVVAARAAHLAEVEAARTRSKRSVVVTPAGTSAIVAASPLTHTLPIAHAYSAPIGHAYSAPIGHAYSAPIAHAYSTPIGHAYDAYPYAAALRYASPYPHAYPTTHTVPVVTGPHGYLADTPEVAAAKANHFAEVAAATARVAPIAIL